MDELELWSSPPNASPDSTDKPARKKPGRKPNPATPANRRQQNRLAQKHFRERKERRLKELEITCRRLQQEHDRDSKENAQLKRDNDILSSENWYLKGMVLSLQLACFNHKLCIEKHAPSYDEKTLRSMATSAPATVDSYITLTNHLSPQNVRPHHQNNQRSAYAATEQGTLGHRITSSLSYPSQPMEQQQLQSELEHMEREEAQKEQPQPSSPTVEPIMLRCDTVANNMVAIQALRLRLKIQAAVIREGGTPYTTEPSLLQLTVPHDPRIDLIPANHMRDRMILFRDQFDLDDCLQELLNGALLHGDDPTQADNWELPRTFIEKYWYLIIDYSQDRSNQDSWRSKPSVINALKRNQAQQQTHDVLVNQGMPPASSPSSLSQPLTQQLDLSIFQLLHMDEQDSTPQLNQDQSSLSDMFFASDTSPTQSLPAGSLLDPIFEDSPMTDLPLEGNDLYADFFASS
ncbi:hypothetical protein DM01DRAFT_1322417 [Hesseltinella vesiculosa]|uniref:BZIP domain-containing protein n=1 Tax=Hesseltinella vesiculosa TaxID=101127 RepID=A0A1X2GGR7_9FUNG|nr:hypothetical protein DM01DRAFT_1322417 [Hesseltinella vesiculosa]